MAHFGHLKIKPPHRNSDGGKKTQHLLYISIISSLELDDNETISIDLHCQKCPHLQMCKKVPENNSSTAALQITAEAERKHIFSLLFCTKVATSPCGDDINDKSPS